jgi:hypothetical protein
MMRHPNRLAARRLYPCTRCHDNARSWLCAKCRRQLRPIISRRRWNALTAALAAQV